jgi:hypothetical protein
VILKAGTYYPEDEEPTEVEWLYEPDGIVDIQYKGFTILTLQPDDLLAIADAIRGAILLNEQLKSCRKKQT